MSEGKQYPIPMYKDRFHPRSAHNKKEEETYADDGWTADRAGIPLQEFPKTLYDAKGNTVTVGKFPPLGAPIDTDAAKREEASYEEQGYSSKPVAKREVKPVMETAETRAQSRESNGRIDGLEERMDAIEASLAVILAAVESKDEGEAPKRGRPAKIKSEPEI